MRLPNFIIFGAIKSGTGALYQYLSHHPEIFLSPVKEPRYFTQDKKGKALNKNSGSRYPSVTTLAEYSNQFAGVKSETALGEASSNYIYSRAAAEEIKKLIPDVKLIATLRNPIDRARAHYQMENKSNKLDMTGKKIDYKNERWARASCYHEALQAYYEIFSREQIKVVIFEEWVNNTGPVLKDIYQFLGVDHSFNIDAKIKYQAGRPNWPGIPPTSKLRKIKSILPIQTLMTVNKVKRFFTKDMSELKSEERQEMYSWYSDDIIKLQELLQRDLSVWRNAD
jgi:hypothetical protein